MESLSYNWITEKHIDFEYKKYVLLAYLQKVKKHFDEQKLYPDLAELIEHYENTKRFKDSKNIFAAQFPKLLTGIDTNTINLMYEKALKDEILMQEIENIVEYSLPQFLQYLDQGKEIFDIVENDINIEPIGLVSLQNKFGYLFVKCGVKNDTRVYEYHISSIEQPNHKYSALKTNYLKSYTSSYTHTYNYIKSEIIREHKVFSSPAVYAIESKLAFPFDETLLPVAKRIFMKKLSIQ